jgi:hypothetical protein
MARCQYCGGVGRLVRGSQQGQRNDVRQAWLEVCQACQGSGVESCCDGPVGGPDEVANAPNQKETNA